MYSKWNEIVDRDLARENPNILLRIVELTSSEEGVSQTALKKDLKINQSRLSKLTTKLISSKWAVVQESPTDRRVLLICATDHAKARVEELKTALSACVVVTAQSAPKGRKGLGLPRNQEWLISPPKSLK
jgi:hypothetical protein